MRWVIISAALAGLWSASAEAQYKLSPYDEPYEHEGGAEQRNLFGPISFNVGGALSLPVSQTADRFDPGAGFTAGITFSPVPMIGIQAEYLFSYYNADGDVLAGSNLDGNMTMQYGDLNLVVRPITRSRFGFYILGGPGIYHRNAEVTQFDGVGAATYCDPLLFFCYPTAVPVSTVIGSQSSTDFGLNGGVGAYAVLTPPLRLYLEARYHFIWGPSFTTPNGTQRSSDGQFIPIVLGLAF
jgi:Outer membrane protein beta-barrel domain